MPFNAYGHVCSCLFNETVNESVSHPSTGWPHDYSPTNVGAMVKAQTFWYSDSDSFWFYSGLLESKTVSTYQYLYLMVTKPHSRPETVENIPILHKDPIFTCVSSMTTSLPRRSLLTGGTGEAQLI